jgi:NAD(P)-dependent dehydrogenase (short-subunit alcohol dehydrogenase family)
MEDVMKGRLAGKVALVTGAASGIGRRSAERFAAEGAKVLLTDIQDDKGAEIASTLGPMTAYKRCDVTVEKDIAAAVDEAVRRFGRLDVLLSNAGAPGMRGPIEKLDVEHWDRAMAILLRSVVLGAKHAARVMKPQRSGSIINLASAAGLVAGATPHDYSTAKGAVVHFTKGLALELGEHGIRCNAICPGYTLTPMLLTGLGIGMQAVEAQKEKVDHAFGAVHPVPRAGRVDDIANLALFLASDEASFVNGQAIASDGGFSAGAHWSGHRTKMMGIINAVGGDTSSRWAPDT